MLVNFDTEIVDALGRVQYEPELTPSGRNVLVPVTGDDGDPVFVPGGDGGFVRLQEPKVVPITLRAICITALTRAWPDEKLPEAAAFERFTIALKIADGGEVDLTLEERGQIQRATDNWSTVSPVFMARARLLLDTGSANWGAPSNIVSIGKTP
ncbi:hypothetical protein ASF22_05040 [Methylobacterium sp. Leaf87]|uniref:hypothetical protein n=1 Tax=Methylobacterium sp. Leaf87 TaxID=1736243 RepID=UPI0006F7C4FA|nr:hypothetical protein [Methylobacterium sp. Leaf87]KQO66036.1 hypothetical protein ASF22_05040 [Methylobacterium sp. Leaf87]